ncbi:MAG: hypothetical protein N2444_08780 [Methylocystis sp.]|nr:hypothetical protein [Methylocystis sp.]
MNRLESNAVLNVLILTLLYGCLGYGFLRSVPMLVREKSRR